MRKRLQTPVAASPAKTKIEKGKVTLAKKQKAVVNGGHVLPEPVPFGEILTDVGKKQWQIGKSIGIGGFGEIYLASEDVTRQVSANERYVIKIEPHNNGPLFTEMHFYHRAAKEEMIEAWKSKKKLKLLGMPKFIAFGSHMLSKIKYRFLVMERFGSDLQKKLIANKNKFSLKTALTLGIKILDIIEYIHSTGYIHADIKASNLLLGFNREDEVYLVDYGLACKYVLTDGKHKAYFEDLRKAHDGTIEFTSRDAHVGTHSRRSDLEILGYNLVQWLCGKLPWENNLKDASYVAAQKNELMANIPKFLTTCFKGGNYPEAIEVYLKYVSQLKFDQDPDYDYCRKTFTNGLAKAKLPNDGKLDFEIKKLSPGKRKATKVPPKKDINENDDSDQPAKKSRSGIRRPCGLAQTHRVKRSPKNKSNELLKVKSDPVPVPSLEVPTPAMLKIMQMRIEKAKEKARVVKKMGTVTRSRSSSESSTSVQSPPRRGRPVGRRQLRQGKCSSSSSASSRERHNSITPPLF